MAKLCSVCVYIYIYKYIYIYIYICWWGGCWTSLLTVQGSHVALSHGMWIVEEHFGWGVVGNSL